MNNDISFVSIYLFSRTTTSAAFVNELNVKHNSTLPTIALTNPAMLPQVHNWLV